MKIYQNLEDNIAYFAAVFEGSGDVVMRKFPIGGSMRRFGFVIYLDGMTDRLVVENNVLARLMASAQKTPESFFHTPMGLLDSLMEGGMTTAELKEETDMDAAVAAVLAGDTAIFADGCEAAVLVSTKGFPNRGVPETSVEVVVQGSNEAFSEVMRINTALLRRRVKDVNLKVKQVKVGRRTATDIAICYLDDVVRPEVLKQALERIANIDVDGIFDAGALEELIEEDISSPFPQCQITQRPDKAASGVTEGRVAILVDNSPSAILVPATINSFFQASEDYSQGWEIMSFVRLLRFFAAFFALALPGLYIAITTFHPNMLPMMLTFKMAAAREGIAFPAVLEILIMEFAFELLREAGIRLPRPVGSSIGIIGGLIVGEAAVSAGIVSPIVVIVVALTGIASFAIPSYSLVSAFRLAKFLIIALSAALGLLGFWVALLIIMIHLASLKSFGLPYLFPFVSGDINGYTDFKDSLFRAPAVFMKKRPIYANPAQECRQDIKELGNVRDRE
ncbi:MAG: spore germination protein [Defluviitaleaceae bacterium]|nr:spore germination protein [Defluviitaleaceae bacterium]